MRERPDFSFIASASSIRGGCPLQEHWRRRQGAWSIAACGDPNDCPTRDRARRELAGTSPKRIVSDTAGISAFSAGSAAVRACSISFVRSGHRRVAFRSRDRPNPWRTRLRIRTSALSPRSRNAVLSRRRRVGSTYPSRRCIDRLAISSAWFVEACINEWPEDWLRPRRRASSRGG